MYHITRNKLRYYYQYYNKKIFNDYLPHSNELYEISIKDKNRDRKIWAECLLFKNPIRIGLRFHESKFPSFHFFSEILIHEMVHIADILENGTITGHGESFMKWRLRLLKHGFRLKKTYP